jgi:hypothetical protein
MTIKITKLKSKKGFIVQLSEGELRKVIGGAGGVEVGGTGGTGTGALAPNRENITFGGVVGEGGSGS